MEWYEIILAAVVWIGCIWVYGKLRENGSGYNNSWKNRKKRY